MIKSYSWLLCFLVCAAAMAGETETADDVVLLHNGDRISGAVTTVSGGKVSIATPYAGTIAIELEAVAAIETATSRAIALVDEKRLEGILTQEAGTPGVRVDDTFYPAPFEEVVAVAEDSETLEQLLYPPAPRKWSGTVEVGLALRSGNTDTTDFKFSTGAQRKGERTKLALRFAAAYGSADGTLNTRNMQGDFRWQYYLRERMYLYTIGLAERDDGRKLDYRFQTGAGLGYDIIDRDNRSLSADIGVTYTRERWAPFTPWERDSQRDTIRANAYNRLYAAIRAFGDNGATLEQIYNIAEDIRNPLREFQRRNEDYANVRIGITYSQSIFRASTLSEELVIMPNLEDLGEFRAVSQLALVTPVTDALGLSTSLKTEYDSLARRRGVDRWDNTLMTQLRYKF